MDVILSKAANMLVEDAEVFLSGPVEMAMDAAGGWKPPDAGLAAFKLYHGGLWVGGRITLTRLSLTFAPNGLNRALHRDLSDVEIRLAEIAAIDVLPGFVTKIIAIRLPRHVAKVRCFGASAVAERIRTLGG
jgi:hypothetical protein